MGVTKTKVYRGTWLGRAAVQTTYHFDKNDLGKRVVATQWTDTGEIELRALKGSFWRSSKPAVMYEQGKMINDRTEVVGEVLAMASRHNF